jgi:outer membrane protein TolC
MRTFISTILMVSFVGAAHADISLDTAIDKALKADHWQLSNFNQEMALRSQAIASAQLPDPKVRVALANLPLDSLDFNQENMTQLQFGVSQQFPRGDSLELKQQQLELQAGKNPLQRLERSAQIKLAVSRTWLALHQAEQQLALLQRKKHIFDELVAISRANFRSGKARRFEVLDAELQLTKFSDRIIQLEKMMSQQQAQLQKWLYVKPTKPLNNEFEPPRLLLSITNDQTVIDALTQHPQMQLLAQDIQVKDKGIAIAEEAYKPGFKLDANYGYRDDSDTGMERADFFTVALTMELPLFPEKRQDQRRSAAIQNREASKEIRLLKARELRSGFEMAKAGLFGIEQRLAIYDQAYLKQQSAKRKSALKAYASADARFNEVSMAAITELETQLQQIALVHEVAKAKAEINYYLAGVDPQLQTSAITQESKR